jgi:DNA-binding beta-propeller fold protein YncE
MRLFPVAIACLALAQLARADKLVLVAGGGDLGDGQDATKAKLIQPFGVDFDEDGLILVVEMANGERLRAINQKNQLFTLAGSEGRKGSDGDGGPGQKATFNGMHSLAVGPREAVYLADTWNNRVRLYDLAENQVMAFAGTGKKGYSGDGGPANKAEFGSVYCVAFDPDKKNLYITDLDNRRIRKVDLSTKIVTTVAGNGQKGVPKDGEPAVKQPLVDPRAACPDGNGNLWIVERGGHALRVVNAEGTIRTVAGTGGKGMGTGKALESALNGPKHLCVDRDGTVLIADTENHRIVRYNPKNGILSAVAGTGKKGTGGVGGDPLQAEFSQPHGVAVHPKTGDIYISDSSNSRVLKIVRE